MADRRSSLVCWPLAGLLFCCCFAWATVRASEVTIESARVLARGPLWEVTPRFHWAVEPPVVEAVHSGVALRFQLKGRLLKSVPLWWDTVLESQSHNLEVRYFSLSKQYLLKNLDTGQQRGFLRLDNLWRQMGQLAPLQLPQRQSADAVAIRLRLDTGALPAAMQLPTLLNSAWYLDTGWQRFPLPQSPSNARPDTLPQNPAGQATDEKSP